MKLQSYRGAHSHGRKRTRRAPSRGDRSSQLGRADADGWAEPRQEAVGGWSRGWDVGQSPRAELARRGEEAAGGGHGFWAHEQSLRRIPGAGVVRKPKIGWFDPRIWCRVFPQPGTAAFAERPGGSSCPLRCHPSTAGCTVRRQIPSGDDVSCT